MSGNDFIRLFHFPHVPNQIYIDFSWMLYYNRHALSESFIIENGVEVPTGHVYGSFNSVLSLSRKFQDRLIICVVDSQSPKSNNPNYKATRKHEGYSVHTDSYGLLAMLSSIPNVYYIKQSGLESDDIISSVIEAGLNPTVIGNDVDLLVTPKPFTWVKELKGFNFSGYLEEFSVREYLTNHKKFGMDMDYLSLWWLVVRGKASNNIRPAVPGFRASKLIPICQDMGTDYTFEGFERYIREKNIAKMIEALDRLRENYDLVKPIYSNVDKFYLKKNMDVEAAMQLMDRFNMSGVKSTLRGLGYL